MKRGKKFIIIGLLSALVLLGTLGGVALAADDQATDPVNQFGTFIAKVIGIYEAKTGTTIDQAALQESITQAREELRTEAQEQLRQRLIDEGIMTPEQLEEWEAWLDARPDVPAPFGPGGGNGFHGMGRGFNRFGGGFHGWCQPELNEN